MPARIAKEEALACLARELAPGACPMCCVARADAPLAERGGAILVVNRYPLRWGHLLAVPRRHVTRFSDVGGAEHHDLSELALLGARALEIAFAPARVYVASLGADREGLPMTTPHLHAHVVPVEADARPSDVLTWSNGVLRGDDGEWRALLETLRDALLRVGGARVER